MINLDKKIIAKNFSHAASSYDISASIQRKASQELNCILQNNSVFQEYIAKRTGIRILDLGSGTGFITKDFLAKPFQQNTEIFEIDIAFEMLKSWRNRPKNVFAIQGDFEEISFKKHSFDLLLSSFSLQWICDFTNNFLRFSSFLKPGGVFAFCLPLERSLNELQLLSKESGCDFHFNPFPAENNINRALANAGFATIFFEQIIMEEAFQTRQDAIKSLKKIGAGYSDKNIKLLTKTQLSNFNNYDITAHPPKTSWVVGFFIAHLLST